MKMPFDAFETAPPRTLSDAQETRLARMYLTGDPSGGPFRTILALVDSGHLVIADGKIALTEKGSHYAFHYARIGV